MKLKRLYRAANAEEIQVDSEKRSFSFSFSSEFPVERYFGTEILSHKDGAMDLTRVDAGATPLLWNHDPDQPIGMIKTASIKSGRGLATAEFFSTPFAQEKMQQMNEGLRNISFGYQIDEMDKTGEKSNVPEYTATRYEIFEISLVSIPADPTIGVGRAKSDEEYDVIIHNQLPEEPITQKENTRMTPEEQKAFEAKVRAEARADAEKHANERALVIGKLGEKFKDADLARQLLEGGKSIEEARAAFLDKIQHTQKPVAENAAMIDLTEKDQRSYSLLRAVNAQLTGDWKKAGFEQELSNEIGKRMGKETAGFFMPMNIRSTSGTAYNTGAATAGGDLVATNLQADSFIELLRSQMLMMSMGAKVLSGLQGNITIPKQTSASTAYWVAEGADVTESEAAFGLISLSPKTVGARSQMTRQMLIQSTPDIENFTRVDLAKVIALAIDLASLAGTGSGGQPTGILNQSGIGSVPMGANGLALTNLDPLIDLETLVATANADFGSLGYITNPKVVGEMKKLKATTGQYLWNGYEQAVLSGVPGEINGYKVGRTNQMPSTFTKGTSTGICSGLLFGNFNDLIIGLFGPGVEILANPFGAGFNSGSVDIRALTSVDVNVRHAASFAAITDIL